MLDRRRTRVAATWPLTILVAVAACVQAEPHPIQANTFGESRALTVAAPTAHSPASRDEPPAAEPAAAGPARVESHAVVAPTDASLTKARAAEDPVADGPAADIPSADVPAADGPAADGPAAAEQTAKQANADPAVLEVELRQRLATAADPTEDALELAGLLADLERREEALQVVDNACSRKSSTLLRIARASLQRDLGRRHLAVAELRALVREVGPEKLGAGVLFELTELEWLEGNRDEAAAALATLRRTHVTDDWLSEHATEVQGLGAEIQRGRGPERVSVRDLLGNLRGAPQVTVRMATLERLLAIAAENPSAGEGLHLQAVAIAAVDPSPAVRAFAVRKAMPAAADIADFCHLVLDDSDPLVRRFAAARVAELMGHDGVSLLMEQLTRETDAAAFLAIHDALCTLLPGAGLLLEHQVTTPAQRQQVVQQWRDRCQQ